MPAHLPASWLKRALLLLVKHTLPIFSPSLLLFFAPHIAPDCISELPSSPPISSGRAARHRPRKHQEVPLQCLFAGICLPECSAGGLWLIALILACIQLGKASRETLSFTMENSLNALLMVAKGRATIFNVHLKLQLQNILFGNCSGLQSKSSNNNKAWISPTKSFIAEMSHLHCVLSP